MEPGRRIGSVPCTLRLAISWDERHSIRRTRIGINFPEDAEVFLSSLEERLDQIESLRAAVETNPPENSRITFEPFTKDVVQGMMDINVDFCKETSDNPRFAEDLACYLFDRYRERVTAAGE